MDSLHLALLAKWAEDEGLPGIQGRKRLQKVIYFLQQAGCPITADYTLHRYGPYSREVANATDVMVAEGLLTELGGSGSQYNYKLGEHTRPMIDRAPTPPAASSQPFGAFKDKAVELLRADIWHLELGSTILYFYRSHRAAGGWEAALRDACKYKNAVPSHPASSAALVLAKRFAATNA